MKILFNNNFNIRNINFKKQNVSFGNEFGDEIKFQTSPLTQDFIDKYFAGGFFVNGTYLGYTNPIFMPINNEIANTKYGALISETAYGFTITRYTIYFNVLY